MEKVQQDRPHASILWQSRVTMRPVDELRVNERNPRVVKTKEFDKLVRSIRDFPEMLRIRPIVVDADGTVLGGNQRLRAAVAAGMSEVPVYDASNLSVEERAQFVIRDNATAGEWDFDMLASEWDSEQLTEWGLDIPDMTPDEIVEEAAKTTELRITVITTDDQADAVEAAVSAAVGGFRDTVVKRYV